MVLWNLHDGRREGGFSLHSHPTSAAATGRGAGRGAAAQPKLTAMGFDAAQRRLLTATYGGAVKLWNFNRSALGWFGCDCSGWKGRGDCLCWRQRRCVEQAVDLADAACPSASRTSCLPPPSLMLQRRCAA